MREPDEIPHLVTSLAATILYCVAALTALTAISQIVHAILAACR